MSLTFYFSRSLAVHTDNVQLASNKSKSVSPLVPNEHEAISKTESFYSFKILFQ
jgi:hypothetical protein